jgi:hypothetical protein
MQIRSHSLGAIADDDSDDAAAREMSDDHVKRTQKETLARCFP